ncbi:MAG: sugar phosphate isomerase/epimerase [Verrucomicrobia bacterium]|nr:sugar phosphate isomerase/epimerase [Verrucomicrobiota bacterium]
MKRREFIRSSVAVAALAPHVLSGAEKPSAATPSPRAKKPREHKKGFMNGSFRSDPKNKQSVRERFQLLRDAGFAGIEIPGGLDQKEILAAQDATGLQMASVTISTHWTRPLSDPNPSVRQTGLEGLMQGLRDAKAYGATSVLLVPAVVTKQVSYADAYARSVAEITKAVPLAESLGVAIAIENVWNHFLLSPLEAVAYVDAFKSPMVRWHFDVGNVVDTGWPEQWARTLGRRIAKVHVKEYSRKLRDEKGPRAGFQVDLFDGDSDWPAVMAAFDDVGYSGWLITEQYRPPGRTDAEWFAHLSAKLDKIIAC